MSASIGIGIGTYGHESARSVRTLAGVVVVVVMVMVAYELVVK